MEKEKGKQKFDIDCGTCMRETGALEYQAEERFPVLSNLLVDCVEVFSKVHNTQLHKFLQQRDACFFTQSFDWQLLRGPNMPEHMHILLLQ